MKSKRGYYDVFVQTCAKYPSSIAIRHYDNGLYKSYTYSELYGVCEYISQNLLQLKCNKGIIGIISDRNLIIPCIIAAAHKCCTTFMFLDPSQDFTTLNSELNFNVIIIVNDKETSLKRTESFFKKPDKTIRIFNIEINLYDLKQQNLSRYKPLHSFIAMTSGSTGEPKHIQVPIQCIQPNIDDLTKLFNIISADVIYFSTPLTFDPSMIEILLACLNGASLLIAPEKPDILFSSDKENSITFWQTTPSKFFQLSNADIQNKILSDDSTLKILALGGEPLNGIKRLQELKGPNNSTKIFTLYGVTEMSCWACAAELDLNKILSDTEVPLGNCLSETQIHIENEDNQDQKIKSGKIILVSKSRRCIILNRDKGNEDESSLKFIDTGDFGEIRNGNIYYRGRKDDVIKRFGHKINLQLIETTIMQCPKIKTCSCIWLPKPMQLVVYYSSESFSSQELSNFLKCKLDDKHWPDKIIRVNSLPTSAHGKISKSFLSKLYKSAPNMPKTLDSMKESLIIELKYIMNKSFIYEDIKNKDFFSIGGTSFLAVAMCNTISFTYPDFGKFILPYLLTPKKTIDEIMQLAQKELFIEELNNKRKMKRCRSSSNGPSDSQSVKKVLQNLSVSPDSFVIMWSYDTGKCVDASPTLFQIGHNLYATVGSHSGKVIVMDAISGTLQGEIAIKARVEASVVCCNNDSMPPCGVVGAYDGTIICFKIQDCHEIWRLNIHTMIKSKGVCCNDLLYIAAYDGKVRCINVLNGRIECVIDVAEQGISADLVLAKNGYILLGTLSGVCAAIHSLTNTIAWRGSVESPVFASPVLYDNDKYVMFAEVNGVIHCRTVDKGVKIWQFEGASGNIFSSIYVKEVDKFKWQMIFGCHDKNVYSIFIKHFQPSLHWKAELTSPVYSTPTGLYDEMVIAASNNGTICVIDFETGNILVEYKLPGEIFSSPAVFGNSIFIGCRNDYLYSLKFNLN